MKDMKPCVQTARFINFDLEPNTLLGTVHIKNSVLPRLSQEGNPISVLIDAPGEFEIDTPFKVDTQALKIATGRQHLYGRTREVEYFMLAKGVGESLLSTLRRGKNKDTTSFDVINLGQPGEAA